MLKVEKVRLADSYIELKGLMKQLDHTNIKILSAMYKFGPRNLLEVSRRTGIPFTSVYHRVGKLEAETGRVAYLIPKVSKLGMMQLTVQVAAKPGREDKVTKALKNPGFWQWISSCETPFTHHSVHAVPASFVNDFRKYLRRLPQMRLVTQQRVIPTGDFYPNFPNFRHFDPAAKEWKFEWNKWLTNLKKTKPTKTIEDPHDYQTAVDKRDLLIVRELERNARTTFADMAPVLGISLQGVKYHFDKKLVPSRIVQHFGFEIKPYPKETSANHEVILEFANRVAMNRFFSMMSELFWVQGASKILRSNALLVRTYIPQCQLQGMFDFFSELARAGIIQSYSSVRLSVASREIQTILPEHFKNQQGWVFDARKLNSDLSKLS